MCQSINYPIFLLLIDFLIQFLVNFLIILFILLDKYFFFYVKFYEYLTNNFNYLKCNFKLTTLAINVHINQII